MKAYEVIKQKISERGITLTFVSQKSGISIKILSSCLNGNRQIKADELVSVCRVLGLSIADFCINDTNKVQAS